MTMLDGIAMQLKSKLLEKWPDCELAGEASGEILDTASGVDEMRGRLDLQANRGCSSPLLDAATAIDAANSLDEVVRVIFNLNLSEVLQQYCITHPEERHFVSNSILAYSMRR